MVPATAEDLVLRQDAAGVATLTLNRPQARNALSRAMMSALETQLAAVGSDPSIRVVVLGAAGPAFCAGHDLKEIRSETGSASYQALFAQCSRLMTAILRLRQPVIAKVHGVATAAGCQLVATCDLALASSEARFATPGVNIGLFCSTPMVALSRNVGRKAAMEMLLTGEMADAETACEIGLVNRVVAPEKLDAAVDDLARRIAGKSGGVVSIGKEAFYRQLEMGVSEAYTYTSEVMVRNMLMDDAEEGIDAFIEKRPAVWPDQR